MQRMKFFRGHDGGGLRCAIKHSPSIGAEIGDKNSHKDPGASGGGDEEVNLQ